MLRKTILGTLAAGTATGVVLFLHQAVRQFGVVEWLQDGQPSLPAAVVMFALVLVAVGGADVVRSLVRVATPANRRLPASTRNGFREPARQRGASR